jgi:dissimilatory sulfite reductase (desulfoviridin) alpha/beta subunit
MEWTQEAEEAIKKVPFFVRKRVKARVEKEAGKAGKNTISLADVRATQARYLSSMASEIKGYQVETCFGPGGCPNRTAAGDGLQERIEAVLKAENLLDLLKKRVKGDLKFHHEFRISVAECPNACSQPQIKDIGIIGACTPVLTGETCTLCEACVELCKEDAVTIDSEKKKPHIDYGRCLHCGQCIQVCPTGSIAEGQRGFRVQLGGKLGRRPQLAKELPGIYDERQVLQIVKDCLHLYKQTGKYGQRLGQILSKSDFDKISKRYQQPSR